MYTITSGEAALQVAHEYEDAFEKAGVDATVHIAKIARTGATTKEGQRVSELARNLG